ncbi:capsular polysaccharide synthesis protein [Acinetobacter baretiae]|uniref:capsular polysaccharide synthesis protein n=1 Tax=Acinetobacter baretiae TaxID=2605383 RepID=UPI0018C2C9B3|nr:capsular polysaccharide synthesis protein [Acinetobacter baretiae]
MDNYAGLLVKGHQSTITGEMPKKIWVYWEGEKSEFLKACLYSMQHANKDYEMILLNEANLKAYCDLDWSKYQHLTPQLKSDLLRLYLLYEYGGVWLDASILVHENFAWIQRVLKDHQVDSFAYYRIQNTLNKNYPIVETWLLASKAKQPFFKAWFDELSRVVSSGIHPYLEQLKKEQDIKEITQNIGIKKLDYFIVFVVCQKVMRTVEPSMVLIDCDQNVFNLQVRNDWLRAKLLIDLSLGVFTGKNQPPHLIKFIGKERHFLQKYYAKKQYLEHSPFDVKNVVND